MPSLDELELEGLLVGTSEFSVDPPPYLEGVRQKHPGLAKLAAGYVVTDYASRHGGAAGIDRPASRFRGPS